MDTKLKNFKFNSIIKTVIILLTLVFAFLAGTNAFDLARKTIYYSNESETIQNTPVFLKNVERVLLPISWNSGNLDSYGQNISFEEYCEKIRCFFRDFCIFGLKSTAFQL